MSYNSYRCKFGSNYILWNSVTVARQTLTRCVGVRIPIPLPFPRNIRVPRLFYARILLFTAVFEQSVCVLCKISFIFFKVYSVGTRMPMSFVPIKITRFFGFMFKALHSSLSNNLSLSTANNPAPIAPQNSGYRI